VVNLSTPSSKIDHVRDLPLIHPEDASGATAVVLAAAQELFGITPNLTKAMANSPAALRGYLEFHRVLGEGRLTRALRERIALLVAQEHECDYCLSEHTYRATRTAGLTAAQASDARAGRADEPREAAVLAFAAALVRARGAVDDGQLDTAHAAGLTAEDIVEITADVALNVFANYLALAARVDVDWPLVRPTSAEHDAPGKGNP
jgi:uncharacterized peroxidase-related enzyme